MTDLETRVRETLTDHAGSAGEWRVPGEALRGAAADRASSRRRTAAVAAGALVVAGVVGVAAWSGDGPREATPTDPTPTASSAEPVPPPEPSWTAVQLDATLVARVREALGASGNMHVLVSAHPFDRDEVVVLLSSVRAGTRPPADGGLVVVSATLSSDQPDAEIRPGTMVQVDSWAEVIAVPTRLTDAPMGGDLLVVLLPPLPPGDGSERMVTAVTDGPERSPMSASTVVADRLSFAVLTGHDPSQLTTLVVSDDETPLSIAMPPGSPLGPARLTGSDGAAISVVTTARRNYAQVVQMRSNGGTACRMTIGTWTDAAPLLPWNAIDTACAPIDGDLHLLIAEDRRYSSVAGVVPDGTATVRLTWRSGSDTDVTETPVRNPSDEVPVFIDESGHRPDQLTRAEALDANGGVLATVRP